MATKNDVEEMIRERMQTLKPLVEEYHRYEEVLRVLNEPVDFSSMIEESIPYRSRSRSAVGQVVSAEQRLREIMDEMYAHPDHPYTPEELAEKTPSPGTPGAVQHRLTDLVREGCLERWQDPVTGRKLVKYKSDTRSYAYLLTEKGKELYEQFLKSEKNEEKEKQRPLKIHAGVGVVPPSN